MGRDLWRLSVPWALAQLGVRKWLKERALHVPEAFVADAAQQAGVSVQQWRAVEAVQASLLYGVVLSAVEEGV